MTKQKSSDIQTEQNINPERSDLDSGQMLMSGSTPTWKERTRARIEVHGKSKSMDRAIRYR